MQSNTQVRKYNIKDLTEQPFKIYGFIPDNEERSSDVEIYFGRTEYYASLNLCYTGSTREVGTVFNGMEESLYEPGLYEVYDLTLFDEEHEIVELSSEENQLLTQAITKHLNR